MHPRRSSSARIPLFGAIAALFLALNLTGCAYIGAAIVLATAGGGGGGGGTGNQQREGNIWVVTVGCWWRRATK